VGARGGPMVALLPSPEGRGWGADKLAAVLARMKAKIGAAGIVVGDVDVAGATRVPESDPTATAALLALASVCVGDDDDWAHVGAAVGAPVVIVHGESSPVAFGPSSRHGAAAYTTRGTCDLCVASPGRRCLACLAPDKVADIAEELAASGWPWDRLARVMP
jgi:ADP-heptose:LPS heptosyltransferase